MQGWKSSLSVIRAGDLLHPWEHTWVYKASIHLSTMEKTKGQASWFFTIDTGWTLHSRHTSSYCILGISIALRTLYKNFVIANFFYIISRLLMHLRHFHLEIYYCKPLKKIYFQICVSNMFGPFSELMIFLKLAWHIHSKHHLQKVNKRFPLF